MMKNQTFDIPCTWITNHEFVKISSLDFLMDNQDFKLGSQFLHVT